MWFSSKMELGTMRCLFQFGVLVAGRKLVVVIIVHFTAHTIKVRWREMAKCCNSCGDLSVGSREKVENTNQKTVVCCLVYRLSI